MTCGWQRLLFTQVCAWLHRHMRVSGTSTKALRDAELCIHTLILSTPDSCSREACAKNAWAQVLCYVAEPRP